MLDVTIKESPPGYLYGKIGIIDVCYLPCNKANAEITKDTEKPYATNFTSGLIFYLYVQKLLLLL